MSSSKGGGHPYRDRPTATEGPQPTGPVRPPAVWPAARGAGKSLANAPDIGEKGAVASRAWVSVCDEVLAGVAHAMNNRLAAISSLTRVLEFEEPGETSLRDSLVDEVDALESTIRLLGTIPRGPMDGIEPVRLQDLLPSIIRLHGLRGEMRELEVELDCDEAVPPVLTDPVFLSRALLVALGPFSRAALTSANRKIAIRCAPEGTGVSIHVVGLEQSISNDRFELDQLEAARVIARDAAAEVVEVHSETDEAIIGLRLRLD